MQLLSKSSCEWRSEQKTTRSWRNQLRKGCAPPPPIGWRGASTESAPLLGAGIVCEEKYVKPAPSLAAPIWEPHLSVNAGAILVFQASEWDLCLLRSTWIYWSYSRTNVTAVYPAELNIRFEDGGIGRCGKEEGSLGRSFFLPSYYQADSDAFPRHSGSRTARINEASLPLHFTS